MKDDCSILWLYLNVHAESIFLFWRLMQLMMVLIFRYSFHHLPTARITDLDTVLDSLFITHKTNFISFVLIYGMQKILPQIQHIYIIYVFHKKIPEIQQFISNRNYSQFWRQRMQGENTKKLISGGNGVCLTAVSSYGGVPKEQNGCCVCVGGGSAVFFSLVFL